MSRKSKNKKVSTPCSILKGVIVSIVIYAALAAIFTALIHKNIVKIEVAHILSCASIGVSVLIGCIAGGRKNHEKRVLITGVITTIIVIALLLISLTVEQGDGSSFLHSVISVCAGWITSMIITRRIKRRRR